MASSSDGFPLKIGEKIFVVHPRRRATVSVYTIVAFDECGIKFADSNNGEFYIDLIQGNVFHELDKAITRVETLNSERT